MRIFQKITLPFKILTANRDLFFQLLQREVQVKYKGSYLGIIWNILTPLFMLLVYTFVFGIVFKAKWENQATDSFAEFSLTLFAGILMYNFFSEAVNRSTTLIISNANYVKKVIFPIELLSMAHIGSLFVQMLFNLLIVFTGKIIFLNVLDWHFILFIFIVVPLVFVTLGISWFCSAVSVFIKDTQQTVSIVVLILGYLTPVFYPINLVPEKYRWILYMNPLTYIVNAGRDLLMYGKTPQMLSYLFMLVLSYCIMMLGFIFFRKVKTNFADVL